MLGPRNEDFRIAGADRRGSRRVPFGATVAVREFDGNHLPDASQFCPVQALDLSHSGISFQSENWPVSDSIVIQMQERGHSVFAAARIVGCIHRCGPDPLARFEVHCEFERWLTPEAGSVTSA